MASQIAMLLATAAVSVLTFMGALEVWHLIALNLLRGGAFSFNMPARQAYTGDLVGPDLLRSAVSLQNAGHNFNRVAGPAATTFNRPGASRAARDAPTWRTPDPLRRSAACRGSPVRRARARTRRSA